MKKCSKCGVELPDDARFCNNCGANLSEDAADTSSAEPVISKVSQNNEILANAKKANRNKKLGLIALVAAGALVLLILFCLIISAISGGYKKPIKNVVKQLNNQNISVDGYLDSFLPKYARKSYNSIYKMIKSSNKQAAADIDAQYAATLAGIYTSLASTYGDDYKITLDYKNTEKLESDEKEWREIEEAWDQLSDDIYNANIDDSDFWESFSSKNNIHFNSKQCTKAAKIGDALVDDIDHTKIQGAYKVRLKMNIKGSKQSDTVKVDFYVVKVAGKWIIDPASSFYNPELVGLVEK